MTPSRRAPTNLAASVREKLRQVAVARGQELQLILTRYGVERLLYRLSQLPAGGRFVLKGAALFYLWDGEIPRPTQDVDLLGFGDSAPEAVARLFREMCNATVDADGLTFSPSSVTAARMRGRQEYGGVRVKLTAMLGNARIPLQVDVGFGDAVTPEPRMTTFPPLLSFPAPRVRAYPAETVVAEKFQAMVSLGIANTRMKDFYDLHHLAETRGFDGASLAKAIKGTFKRRGTTMPIVTPLALSEAFVNDDEKQAQWRAFLRRGRLERLAAFGRVVARIAEFVMPVVEAVRDDSPFDSRWTPTAGWTANRATRPE